MGVLVKFSVQHLNISGGSWKTALINSKNVTEGKKTFTTYTIQVRYVSPESEVSSWFVTRRYSEFDNFNKNLSDQFPRETKMFNLKLGGKKPFGNKNSEFIQKRGQTLVSWLHTLTSEEFLSSNVNQAQILNPSR